MKHGSTLFLKCVLLLLGLVGLSWLIWFPLSEGRAANLDLQHIYLDIFIIYMDIIFIPFFIALFQAFKILGYIDRNQAFSQQSVNALRNIKRCAVAISLLIAIAVGYVGIVVRGEDNAGALMMGFMTTFASIVVATAAAVFARLLQNAVDMKSENDLTV